MEALLHRGTNPMILFKLEMGTSQYALNSGQWLVPLLPKITFTPTLLLISSMIVYSGAIYMLYIGCEAWLGLCGVCCAAGRSL